MKPAEEVAPGIFLIKQAIKYKKVNFPVNVYVMAGNDGMVFDSGFGTVRAGRYLERHIRRISSLIKNRGDQCSIHRAMTSHGHWDHFSGLAYLQKNLGFDILATQKQAFKLRSRKTYKKIFWPKSEIANPAKPFFLRITDNVWRSLFKEAYLRLLRIRFISGRIHIVRENEVLSINGENWQLLSLPGHCDDDVALYNQSSGILLSGDIVLRSITTWLGPTSSNLERYMDTLESIKNLPNLNLILPAHGSPITNPVQRIQEAIDHRHKRTQAVLQTVCNSSENGITYEDIFQSFYPKSRRIQRTTLGGWIVVTLEYLLETEKIKSVMNGREIFFKAVPETPCHQHLECKR